jgi:methyl-accepting chemotaxis protein
MSESSERLDRIERMVESNAKAILALANQATEDRQQIRMVAEGSQRTNDAVTALVSVVERHHESISNHSAAIESIEEGTRSTNAAIESIEEGTRSTNAAIGRMDRILDYLMRKEQEK